MEFIFLILIFVIAYLYGSIPSGLFIGRLLHNKDVREVGSGGTGTTNSLRAFGKKTAVIVFLFDLSKVLVPYWIALLFQIPANPIWLAFGAALGHCFPIFADFRGGKAAAVAGAAALFYATPYALFGIAVLVATIYTTRIVSIGSMLGSLAVLLLAWFTGLTWFALPYTAIVLLLFFAHRANIQRLLTGTENKLF
ncbi:MAG: glycerol-3-phosphate 1-O-acyltransferase PlsY [Culicoidibacterales bacterium]